MCDFRSIFEIQLCNTLEIIPVRNPPRHIYWGDRVIEPGMYSFIASGSWHQYFDGNKWLEEGKDYIVTQSTHRFGHH